VNKVAKNIAYDDPTSIKRHLKIINVLSSFCVVHIIFIFDDILTTICKCNVG